MTVKRNFKRRVRQRQARTGESYVTARRQLLASRPAAPGDDGDDGDRGNDGDPPSSGIPVVELIDVTEEARRVGLMCRVMMFSSLVERIAPARVLTRLHDLLAATVGDPTTERLARLALGAVVPEPHRPSALDSHALRRFLRRARAGLGGTLDDGATLAFHVPDGDTLVAILCSVSVNGTAIELSAIDSVLPERWAALAPVLTLLRPGPGSSPPTPELTAAFAAALQLNRSKIPWPLLWAVYRGRHHPVLRVPFVIGRSAACDLALDGDGDDAEYAAVIMRGDSVYLKDLASAGGVMHHGMRIDHKRIDEGDVFQICGHEIQFTFLPV